MIRRLVARRTLLAIVTTLAVMTFAVGASGATGAENFNKVCGACHTVGGGKRVGPDLKGATDRHSEEWLLKFIASSQTVVKSGDPAATALFNEFKVVMPDAPYNVVEIKDILDFIRAGGTGAAPVVSMRPATPEDIHIGEELFQGTIAFTNGGPACNSCHHVRNDAVIGGGILAKELTSVFGRMGAPGVQAILGKPPFPVMDEAFKGRPLTDDEVVALVAFLQNADAQQAFQQPRDYGFKLVYSGAGGLVVLMGFYGVFWRRRKNLPVNHKIFERQIKTE